jgi:hypothetical protein
VQALGWSGDVEVEQVAVALDEDAVGAGDGDLLVGGLGDRGGVELGALALGAADRAVGAVDGALHKLEGVTGGGVDARQAAEVPDGDGGGVAQQLSVLACVDAGTAMAYGVLTDGETRLELNSMITSHRAATTRVFLEGYSASVVTI